MFTRKRSTVGSVTLGLGLCTLVAAAWPLRAAPPAITVDIGQPSIWSLAQAHYLLANMHQENRGLKVPMPTTELNPSTTNGARLDFLRSAFSADVQYSGPQGAQNRITQDRYGVDFARREGLRAEIDTRREQLANINRTLVDLKLQLAEVQGELASQTADAAAQDVTRKGKITHLTGQIDARTTQKDVLAAEITSLSADEKALALQTPTLAAPTPTGAPIADSIGPLLGKALDKIGSPSLSASMVLDSFVQMQYEVIAKQLTLLRDEVGPDERVVFLELPSSLYSVPGEDENYLVQMKWTVRAVLEADLTGCRPDTPPTLDLAAKTSQERTATRPTFMKRPELSAATLKDAETLRASIERLCGREVASRLPNLQWPESTDTVETVDRVRTVDIIPRQSALNVNDHHATQKSFNLMGLFTFLSGVGAKVGYERQRTLYEQFLHQEVFASGFGKGRPEFGWTFGPVPGTKRLAPGVRNTHAVLVVPRNTLGIRLSGSAVSFKRKDSPAEGTEVTNRTFDLLVPRELTDGFWIDRIAYTPVPRGQRVVAVLEGAQISPQVGILVNGVPLRRAVAIGRHESALTSTATAAMGIDGEYEYIGSDTIITSFSMGDAFVGTPTIVLVTPEKTTAINQLDLLINYGTVSSLADRSLTEPMFTEAFELKKIEPLANGTIRITGTGFRPRARFAVNGVNVPNPTHSHTQEYIITPPAVPAGKFSVQVLQPTRQGFEARELTYEPPAPAASNYKALDVAPDANGFNFRSTLELTVPGTGNVSVAASPNYVVISQTDLGNNKYLLTLRAKPDDFLLTATRSAAHVFAIKLPIAPTIERVDNLSTLQPTGPANAETLVRLRGRHLQHVVRVFFGDREGTLVNVTANVVLVRTPKGDPASVPVYVETSLEFQGRTLTNANDFASNASKPTFTFVKPDTNR